MMRKDVNLLVINMCLTYLAELVCSVCIRFLLCTLKHSRLRPASSKTFSMETSGTCQSVSPGSGLWVHGASFLQRCRVTPLSIYS